MPTTVGSPRASGSGCRHGHPPAGKVPDASHRLDDSGGGARTVPPWPNPGAGRVGPRPVVERIGGGDRSVPSEPWGLEMVCPGSCVRDRAAAHPGVSAPRQMPLTAGVAVTGDADAQSRPGWIAASSLRRSRESPCRAVAGSENTSRRPPVLVGNVVTAGRQSWRPAPRNGHC